MVSSLFFVLPAGAPIADAAERDAVSSVATTDLLKAVSCKGAKILVTIGKRRTCRPIGKVLPKPKAGDPRLAYLRQVLKFDPAKAVRGRKRKRARTLQSGFGAAGRRAQRKLLRLLPRALAFVDRKRKGGGARSAAVSFSALSHLAGTATASAGCQPGPAGPTGHTGGASIGTLGDNGLFIDASVGGLRVRITFVDCRGTTLGHIPDCPAANGSVDAQGSGQFRATIEIWNGGELVSRNSSVFDDKTKAHGEVGADAKLKLIDVEHTQEVFIVASGGIVIRGGVTRKTRIAMPGGRYDPARTSVRYFGDKVSDDGGAEAFAGTAAAAISSFGTAEGRWSSFDSGANCAEPVFSPQSNTLKLRKNDNKQLGVFAKARANGGQASEARWTLTNVENAELSPGSSEAAAPTFSYRVTNAPASGFVKVSVKFTSTAGVGRGNWTQPVEQSTINHIAGTFSLSSTAFGSVYKWSGNVRFDRYAPAVSGGAAGLFRFKEGQVTETASGSGAYPLGAPLCSQKGSVQLGFGAGTELSVIGSGPELAEPPYEYTFGIVSDDEPIPMIQVEVFNCPESAKEQEGTYPLPASFAIFTSSLQKSADGMDYSGSKTTEQPNITVTETWSFQGTE